MAHKTLSEAETEEIKLFLTIFSPNIKTVHEEVYFTTQLVHKRRV